MLSKKLFFILLGVFIAAIVVSTPVANNTGTYSILRLIGKGDLELLVRIIALIYFFLYLLVIAFVYKKVSSEFYTHLYNSKYENAQNIINKYYKQNKTMFRSHYVFLAYATGEGGILEGFCKNKRFSKKRKGVICRAYKNFIDFLNEADSDFDIEKAISVYEEKQDRNENFTYMLKALNYLNKGDYQNAKDEAQKVERIFRYAANSVVLNKIIIEANIKLGEDYSDALRKMQEAADNEFLLACTAKMRGRCDSISPRAAE